MHGSFSTRAGVVLLVLLLLAVPASAGNLTIDLDYSFDTNNFFTTNPQAEVLLNEAAAYYDSIINTTFTAIDPAAASATDGQAGIDSWTAQTFNPSNTSLTLNITNPTINANTIVIYVGGSNFSGSELGLGGHGGYTDSGAQNSTWFDTVQGRGVSGALGNPNTQTAYATWGGSISFSNSGSWYFDPNLAANNTVPSNKFDFYSVALHELGHVLGLGTANVWNNDISNGNFTGANAVAANGTANVTLSPDLGHWAEGTLSDVFGTNTLGNATMTPALPNGQRNLVTVLDTAGLQDLGWAIVPEPAVWSFAAALVVGLHAWRRKKSSATSS
jgi:hypothetical protein